LQRGRVQVVKIEFEGREWDFDADAMDVRQATVLHMTYQLNILQYNAGFDVLDQRVYHFAYWLMLQQAGVVKPIADCNFNVIEFMAAVTEARMAEDKAEEEKAKAEPDPTSPPPSPTDSAASPASSTPPAMTPWHSGQQEAGAPIAS
jgi:hypothetical protein